MKMIVGLGNPEKNYLKTRHNTGVMALEWLAKKHGATWQLKTKLQTEQARVKIGDEAVLLVKSTLNYNNNGMSVRLTKDFYTIDNTDILIIHDELALPFGTIRTRLNGSDAGNNGVKNIISHIGTDFKRVRFGIAQESRLASDMDFVLSEFNKAEAKKMSELFVHCQKIINRFADGKFETDTYKL